MKAAFCLEERDVMRTGRRRPSPWWGYLPTLFFFGLAGCGPVTTTSTLADARIAIEGARGAQADQLAVYEFVSAEAYYRKAREEEGLSDFQAAIDFARQARAFADKAKARALARSSAATGAAEPALTPAGPTSVTPNRAPSSDGLPSGSAL